MELYERSVVPIIESAYDNFTNVEKQIADFFIHNKEKVDLSSKNISNILYVSEASLSRFAKKCGFRGYREFLYRYEEFFSESKKSMDDQTKSVLESYQEILNKTYNLFNQEQIGRIVNLLSNRRKVYVYGIGSSGLTAREFKLRFMRVGIEVESITDRHIMKMNSVIIDNSHIVIGISISGETTEVICSLEEAKKRGATTILITSKKNDRHIDCFDETVLVALRKNIEKGNLISPQFPILVILDIIYTNLIQNDRSMRQSLHEYTLSSIVEK